MEPQAPFSDVACSVGGVTSDAKRNVVVLNSMMFGLIHLLNVFGSRYGPVYIALQVSLGMMIGLFYSMRFLLSATIIEPILLHACNNLYSSFLPVETNVDLTDWLFAIPRTTRALLLRCVTVSDSLRRCVSGVCQWQ